MQHLKSFLFIALVLVSSSARAQDPATPPPPPPAPETPPAPEPPAPAAQPLAELPPKPAPRKRPPVVVEEAPPASAGFGLEVGTSGFASGELQGGLMLGVHISNGTMLGARLDYLDRTRKVGSESRSTSALGLGLAARFPVAGSKAGLDLALALDLMYVKAHADAGTGPDVQVASDATGFRVGIGPQLRYWIRPSVAVGYLVQISHTSTSSEQDGTSSSGDALEDSLTNIVGTFTVTAGF